MANKLKRYDFKGKTSGRGRPALYPWGKWTNGEIWRVKEGADFESVDAFLSSLRSYAHRKGLAVQCRKEPGLTTTIVFRFGDVKKKRRAR